VHRGCGEDEQLWWTVYSTNDGWSDDTVFPSPHWTATTPSLVEFKGTLYCFHRGRGKETELYYCTFDTERKTWNNDIQIKVGDESHGSPTGCAVAVFNDELHLVYQRCDNHSIHHIIFNKTTNTWRNNNNNPSARTRDTPALVAYKNELLLVHRGDGDDGMWYCTYNGTYWNKDQRIPGMASDAGPGLAVFGNEVLMVHRSSSNKGELYYSIYSGSGWSDTKIEGQSTGAPPALACYTDPQCKPDNYEDSKTAVPRLICVHRGWGK
jgi:hypothetical protein